MKKAGTKQPRAPARSKARNAEPVLPAVNEAAPSHEPPSDSAPFHIAGIGASAGGIEALSEFVQALAADTGMAFVVVQHLSPKHPSMLVDILARLTTMKVEEARHKQRVKPDHLYVIPPGQTLVIGNGLLQLTPRTEEHGQHRPVDHFLRSLAEEMGHKAIGVIFSGTGNDGTLGMEEVKAGGGITFAQDDSASQASMPRSAVAAGVVDFVLPPEEIAREIVRISRHPLLGAAIDGTIPEAKDPLVLELLRLVRHATGVDFSNYKYNTVRRRIARRIVLHKLDSVAAYFHFTEAHPEELDALYQDILISVTSFFRNADAYEALKTEVFPKLAKQRTRHEPVRIWALGCSTGEEAYSLAMSFTEYLEDTGKRNSVQIIATDLNGAGIEKARQGIYPKGITQDVSPERLRRFFIEVDGSYRVCKPIRDMCIFARQNVLADPPFSRMDLIACRNMMIYLDASLQQRLIPLLHYALRPDGYLWLGASETIGSYRDLFAPESSKHKIYAKRAADARLVIPVREPRLPVPLRGEAAGAPSDPQRDADRFMLTQYAPPGVIVNARLEIIQFRGDTGIFLNPAPGRASLNLMRMLREGLSSAVRSAIAKVRQVEQPVREEGLHVRVGDGYRDVTIAVVPLKGSGTPEGTLLILFEEPEQSATLRMRELGARGAADLATARAGRGSTGEKEVARLNTELDATREYLQSVIEQQEAANEELQSANEEVQSANEELQSINEELETSKEEIQSSNEELATVNDELQSRNEELSRSNNDLINLLVSVQMAIVMLGPDLRIRRTTPAADKLLKLIPADVGRPLTDLKLTFNLPDLDWMIVAAIDQVLSQEREVMDVDGHWYLLRIRPYRTLENKIDGVVLVFVDIDALKKAEHGQRETEQRFELLADSAPVLIWVNDLDGTQFVNRAYEEFVGTGEASLRGFAWAHYLHAEDRARYLAAYHDAVARREPFEFQSRLKRADGSYRWMQAIANPRFDGTRLVGYVGCMYDITHLQDTPA